MAQEPLKQTHGQILLVQENRFQIKDAVGRRHLLTLSHSAPVGNLELNRWHKFKIPVMVQYEGEPNLASGIAHKVQPLS